MRWTNNPLHTYGEPWNPSGLGAWVWRAVMLAILVWIAVSGSWLGLVLFALAWAISEVQLRWRWNRARSG
jgi:mannose/fructose/N-acetylgalactosamine-specific phosphotransferase system component IID